MTSDSFLFTSESVNEGHPDKLCDQVRRLVEFYDSRGMSCSRIFSAATSASYSVTSDNPQVSDAVLDACLAQDPHAKARAEADHADLIRCLLADCNG